MIRFQKKALSREGVELSAEYLEPEFRTEQEAVAFIEKYIQQYDNNDFHPEHGYWWRRNDGPQYLLHRFWRV